MRVTKRRRIDQICDRPCKGSMVFRRPSSGGDGHASLRADVEKIRDRGLRRLFVLPPPLRRFVENPNETLLSSISDQRARSFIYVVASAFELSVLAISSR